ncbi:SagB/ThcOx family dehydrogenase [Streptomyces sp. CT34]|uniref:SagB/ThcOx family dehydrogenase n=1 Tax=Streptomyces sp. CT34 TaxID=1553907 RepID=UPI0005BB67D8|nr:SagB/ThcOx family dehydrogenase [Streptomyces sp. CT34]
MNATPDNTPNGTPDAPSHDAKCHYRRNPDLLLEWAEGGGPVLVDCRRWRKFTAKPALVDLLNQLDQPQTADQLHDRWRDSAPGGDVHTLLARLTAVGILQRRAPDDPEGTWAGPGGDGWTPYELAVHARSGHGPVAGAGQGTPPPARLHHPEADAVIALPDGSDAPSRPLTEVLASRRSVRAYAAERVPLPLLGTLLDRSARVRGYLPPRAYEQTQRPAPSGGARHSLEIYVLAREVEGLPAGAYHYDPFTHTLHGLSPWTAELAALQQRTVTELALLDAAPPVSLYLAACAARTTWKYEGMALSLIYRDTGCLMQTLSLAATDLGLASCLTGRMESPATAPFLAPPHHDRLIHVGSLALGLPAAGPASPVGVPLDAQQPQ